jgi:hypothetical protein
VNYLINIYIIDFRHHFIKAFINRVLHFDTTTTSRDEDEHVVLKHQLGSFTKDIKTVMKDIDLLLINELHNHLIALNEAKIRYLIELRKSIYQLIASYTFSFAIRRINDQYLILTKQLTVILVCTGIFTRTMSLLCSHRIQEVLYEEETLQLHDIHSH